MRTPLPGAWYCDGTPTREWAALYPGDKIRTSFGDLPLPPGGDLLYLRVRIYDGRLCVAGQGHDDGKAWLWSDGWHDCGNTYGTSPCAFGPLGLYVSRPKATQNLDVIDVVTRRLLATITSPMGSRGIADVDDESVPHSVDGWYGLNGFAEYTLLGEVWVGQGAQGGLVVRVGAAPLRLVELGSVQFVRASEDADRFSIAAWKDGERGGVLHWLTRAELHALPLVSTVTDPPPVVPPPIILPPVPVEPDPMPLPNHLGALQIIRAAYPPTIDAEQAVALLNRFAWQFKHEGWGLLAKPNGNHGPQPTTNILCSCDWLTNKNGLGFDALRDGPDATTGERGEAGVTWGDGEPYDVSRFVAPVQPADVSAPPDEDDEDDEGDVTPPPPLAWQARMEAQLEILRAEIDGLKQGTQLYVEGETTSAGGGFLSKPHTHKFVAQVQRKP